MKWRERADKRAVEAVIATFCDSAEYAAECLAAVDLHAWEKSYHWLDASGMALYFLDRIQALDLEGKIPSLTLKRLRQNLADNRMRDSSMFAEFCSLNQAFQAAGVEYANEKGFTLTPESCPNSSLRTQLDFDFLVNGRDLELCREELINAYIGKVLDAGGEIEPDFRQTLDLCAMQRLMQALGAYGFLGLVRERTAFLKHIPAALTSLREVLERIPELPATRNLIGELA